MKKLWLTYAWDDTEEGDVDFIVQELDKTSLEVKFDRRQVVPGRRLWPQIGGFITDPNECNAWSILLTANSLRSEACIEELCYALERAIGATDESFPIFALLHQIDPKEMPPALKIRLGISLQDQDWVQRVVAAVEGRSPGYRPEGIYEFVLAEHKTGQGYCLEIRPRFERLAPFLVAVDIDEKVSGNVTHCMIGPAKRIPTRGAAFGWFEGDKTLPDGTHVWIWQGDNEATSTSAYYIFYVNRPKRIWFGRPEELRTVSSW